MQRQVGVYHPQRSGKASSPLLRTKASRDAWASVVSSTQWGFLRAKILGSFDSSPKPFIFFAIFYSPPSRWRLWWHFPSPLNHSGVSQRDRSPPGPTVSMRPNVGLCGSRLGGCCGHFGDKRGVDVAVLSQRGLLSLPDTWMTAYKQSGDMLCFSSVVFLIYNLATLGFLCLALSGIPWFHYVFQSYYIFST